MQERRNTILIVLDELTCYNNLPKEIVKKLKGYQLFKKKCVEFTNIQTGRQQCSPSRSTIMTGIYNTGIQDNVEFNYQYNYIPSLPTNLDTTGKIYKKNDYDITAYYGKHHLDAKYATDINQTPTFNTATIEGMKIYGYDKFNVFGDTYFNKGHGVLADNQIISYILPPNSPDFDLIENGNKLSGVIPFLKARLIDKKSYYIECHITNPHDTTHYIQNVSKIPSNQMNQFSTPFYFEQINEAGASNAYFINDDNPYAVPKHPNLIKNYFENNFSAYKTNKFDLPFVVSYELDYPLNPKINSFSPLFIGTYYGLGSSMTMAESQDDIKSWKNLINNFWGLLFEADSYLEKLYYYFESNDIFDNTNIIIIADHGEQVSAHGLKQKQFPFKESSNVPCLIYSPDLLKNLIGKEVDIYGSLVDILPTQMTLNRLVSTSSFDGKSLLKWNHNKLELNLCEHLNYIPLNIVNSTMYTYNYYFYLQWYYNNYNGQSLTSNPNNYFEYQTSFHSIIVDINGTKYKFGRYYSIYSQILYFLFIKQNQNNFTKIKFIEYIKKINPLSIDSLILYIISNFIEIFTFEEGLNIIFNDFGNIEVYILYYYYAFVVNTLNTNNNLIYITPGCLSSWDINQGLNIFSYLLYDIDSDPYECINLLDTKNINSIDEKLKNQLNNILNFTILEKNCKDFITIVDENGILSLANFIYVLGGIVVSGIVNTSSLTLLGFVGGDSTIDGSLTKTALIEFEKIYSSGLNKIDKFPENPYNLFSDKENMYLVGEEKYIKFIYNNIPLFKNTVLSKGYPNIDSDKFIGTNFNIFPYIQGYKIIQ